MYTVIIPVNAEEKIRGYLHVFVHGATRHVKIGETQREIWIVFERAGGPGYEISFIPLLMWCRQRRVGSTVGLAVKSLVENLAGSHIV